jgi:hypothetical protein
MDTKKRRRPSEHPAASGLSARAAAASGLYDAVDQETDDRLERMRREVAGEAAAAGGKVKKPTPRAGSAIY